MIVVFLGPTMPIDEARRYLDARYLPPVAQGDVLRVAEDQPTAIAIIDGYFERVPSVWHKEILWAMSQGIHVLGAASMGALRAAELERYGMVGVGEIFEAYRDGRLEDDDEVAIVHGPAEAAYVAGSEAMVNIRSTLELASREGVLEPSEMRAIEASAKDLYYPLRVYPRILERALESGVDESVLESLRAWLPEGRVDLKRLDAENLLRRLDRDFSNSPEPLEVSFAFERTSIWDRAVR